MAQTIRNVARRPAPRVLTVAQAWCLTPNMIRVVFAGPELDGFPTGREGGNCKLMIPDQDESKTDFAARLRDGPAPVRRTYTVRTFDAGRQELTIDFVAHGDEGPASRWASRAKPGDFLGFAGPSTPKVTQFDADWYLVAADPSAIPVAAATLEAMPRDAKGVAIFEVTAPEDKQKIAIPAGFDVHWLIHPDPHTPSRAQEDLIRSMDWPKGRVKTCIAGESGVIKSLRAFLMNERKLPKEDMYISGYWKIGLVEDEHQKAKRDGNA
ncbi:NADPH-dependent ferric siderophore reductase [Tateyamaria omphalii]|uniref:NADPH-dependent ferric siderophore reductase n=2 Tax=Tateyamaria omphalii TaxID=299262 RepID=A0A1P8MZH9_9RHOB|nr:siderophore-interacting protein [Tateyamaria omphalii]APX13490.1 NADPH-dependent ferric siderophore reductase [Tateyamaria omphalii]